MPRSRTLAGALAVLSLAALLLSVASMARRFAQVNRESDRKLYAYTPVDDREFIYAGRPVTITDAVNAAGDVTVEVRYGDTLVRLPATVQPGSPQLPGLERHREWLAVVRFAERGPGSYRDFRKRLDAGEVPDRLVIVTRRPLPGADPKSYGQVWRKSWTFDFHELMPDGTVRREQLGFPSGRSNTAARPGELLDGTWQMALARRVMPGHAAPAPKFLGDAVSDAGWRLPVAGVSALVLTLSLAWWRAPERPLAAAR